MTSLELRGRNIVRFVARVWLVLLILPTVLNLVRAFDIARALGVNPRHFVGMVLGLFVVAAIAGCLVCLYRGHSWARWLFVVFFALTVISGVSRGIPGSGDRIWIGLLSLLAAASTLGALTLPAGVRAFYRVSPEGRSRD